MNVYVNIKQVIKLFIEYSLLLLNMIFMTRTFIIHYNATAVDIFQDTGSVKLTYYSLRI